MMTSLGVPSLLLVGGEGCGAKCAGQATLAFFSLSVTVAFDDLSVQIMKVICGLGNPPSAQSRLRRRTASKIAPSSAKYTLSVSSRPTVRDSATLLARLDPYSLD
jgi:hypothetical protein